VFYATVSVNHLPPSTLDHWTEQGTS